MQLKYLTYNYILLYCAEYAIVWLQCLKSQKKTKFYRRKVNELLVRWNALILKPLIVTLTAIDSIYWVKHFLKLF